MGAEQASYDRLGGYELLRELQSGGMGSVYLARKRGTAGFEKLLAIKTIRKEWLGLFTTTRPAQRFRCEIACRICPS